MGVWRCDVMRDIVVVDVVMVMQDRECVKDEEPKPATATTKSKQTQHVYKKKK
jgi:hypothetical protein